MGVEGIGDRLSPQAVFPADRVRVDATLERRAAQGDPTAIAQVLRELTAAATPAAPDAPDPEPDAAATTAAQAAETLAQRAAAGDATAMAQLLRQRTAPAAAQAKGELVDLYD